jgi:ferredoxin
VQDLLYKIKTPKIKKSKITRALSYFKYVILAFLVIVLPLIYVFWDFPLPAFCKYICPAGTLGGAIGLLLHPDNSNLFESLGPLFTWKMVLLIAFVALSIFMYRFFCRFFCPLGAIYGLFNKISFLGVKLDKPKCVDCGLCVSKCKMDIRHVGDHECISCGDCIDVCPTSAISYKGGKFFLAPSEIEPSVPATLEDVDKPPAEIDAPTAKVKTRRPYRAVRIVSAILAVVVLAGALVYYNFIDKPFVQPDVGVSVGDTCPEVELKYSMSDEIFKLSDYRGKVVIINFWGTWCSNCIAELPDFDRIATDYSEEAVVVAVHTYHIADTAPGYITQNYPNSNIIFVEDTENDEMTECTNLLLGGDAQTYPMTVVVDENGVILFTKTGTVNYEMLEEIILQKR